MTGTQVKGPGRFRRGWNFLGKHGAPLQVVIGALAIVVTLLIFWAQSSAGRTVPPVPDNKTTPLVTASTSPALSPSSASTDSTVSHRPTQVGTCLSRSGSSLEATPCASDHGYEVIGHQGECTYRAALDYLDADMGLDVAGAKLDTKILPGWCVMSPLQPPTKGSARARFAAETGTEPWRRCQDTVARKTVPCSQPHMWEYFATGSEGDATPDECKSIAQKYMAKTYNSVDSEIRISALSGVSRDRAEARCVLSPWSDGRTILGTLRYLRDGQVVFGN